MMQIIPAFLFFHLRYFAFFDHFPHMLGAQICSGAGALAKSPPMHYMSGV